MALAYRRAARYRGLTGLPTVPMIALLANPDLSDVLTDDLVAALQTLRAQPADLTSTDAFTDAPHPLSRELRERLLGALDRFGIAHAVLALDRGASAESLPNHFRRLSRLDRVVEHIHAAGAALRYRRIRAAARELRAIAAHPAIRGWPTLLVTDDTVLAMMAAAVDVVAGGGCDRRARRRPGRPPASRRALAAVRQRPGQRAPPRLRRRHQPRVAAAAARRSR